MIEEDEASGKLKKLYEEIKQKRGKISNIMRIHSLNPEAMKKHMDLYLIVMFQSSGLSREEREFIAVVVSVINNCEYCINHHAEALNHYWKNREKISRLLSDFSSVNLSNRQRTMLDYVIKLTKSPSLAKRNDVELLKNNGYSDKEILDINLITSYFNFVNRIALGLGVEFSEEEIRGYKY
jgi:uncharacterized peroxidase-related enzyme